ncbi:MULTISPECIES: NAD-dependent epimerase/dehydratase family protein [Agrobacterium]|uniref:NAD-dependent epimerase/dehydratase family protein n=1 Tax=Agrobacterium tumefaciens TaxID=358 RepID=UPI000EF264CE|nr:hypothetical protein At1D1108_51540 [Agrobacterium tumefaciens]NSY09893.1 NAD(P)-dependent oxidoreductase [Agrobacterium tumefaciens]NSY93415.1 NAD(P)-dependent oxidoreductase [Agrobacterium tumefaciens]
MSHRGTILITGGAGSVASKIRPHLRENGFSLRLLDRASPADTAGDEVVLGDLSDVAGLGEAMRGCQAVLHLAGCTVDGPWEDQVTGNVTNCLAVFEAARAAGVHRVIYASSNHAVGMYPRSRKLDDRINLRPDSRYGVTKAFGELAASYFADKYGMQVLCVRIGSCETQPLDRRRLSNWISPRDLAQLVAIGASHPLLTFAVVYGVSDNARCFYDNGTAEKLGYRPVDRAEDYAADILARDPYPQAGATISVAEFTQGGIYVESEFEGEMERLRQM